MFFFWFFNNNNNYIFNGIAIVNKTTGRRSFLNGEYGIKNIYAGVPIIVGKKGVEKIEVINLDEKEKSEFINSVNAVKKLWEAASKIDPDLAK